MKMTARIIALASLIVLIVPSVMFLTGSVELEKVKIVMLIATIIWFVSAALWMWKDEGCEIEDNQTVV